MLLESPKIICNEVEREMRHMLGLEDAQQEPPPPQILNVLRHQDVERRRVPIIFNNLPLSQYAAQRFLPGSVVSTETNRIDMPGMVIIEEIQIETSPNILSRVMARLHAPGQEDIMRVNSTENLSIEQDEQSNAEDIESDRLQDEDNSVVTELQRTSQESLKEITTQVCTDSQQLTNETPESTAEVKPRPSTPVAAQEKQK